MGAEDSIHLEIGAQFIARENRFDTKDIKSMEISDAIQFISGAVIPQEGPAVWADLGCGSGTFTRALAHHLPAHSSLYAIDKTQQSIPQEADKKMYITFVQADFDKDALSLPTLDGILMANALHYVEDKERLLMRLLKNIRAGGGLLLVEYDTLKANPWVPYPIDFHHLQALLHDVGMRQVKQLAERPSRYRRSNMYSCFAQKQT